MTALMFLQTILDLVCVACLRVLLPSKPRTPLKLGHRGLLGFVVPAIRRSSCASAGYTDWTHTRWRRRPEAYPASWQLAEVGRYTSALPYQLAPTPSAHVAAKRLRRRRVRRKRHRSASLRLSRCE